MTKALESAAVFTEVRLGTPSKIKLRYVVIFFWADPLIGGRKKREKS